MSNYNIKDNLELVQLMLQNEKTTELEYQCQNSGSVLKMFQNELERSGFRFETIDQIRNFLPKQRKYIIPVAIKFYELANLEHDKRYFLSMFHYKGFEECIPIILPDMYSDKVSIQLKGVIAETLRAIHSPKYLEDYVRLLKKTEYKEARNPIIALAGDFKIEPAIPFLISALKEQSNITTNALRALGKYRRKEFKCYFEEYSKHENKYYRQEAKRALKKLE